jgi:hypothetical protein
MKTLDDAIKARDAFPDRVTIYRQVRWYANVDGITNELLPDRETEDVGRYIDQKKAEKERTDGQDQYR